MSMSLALGNYLSWRQREPRHERLDQEAAATDRHDEEVEPQPEEPTRTTTFSSPTVAVVPVNTRNANNPQNHRSAGAAAAAGRSSRSTQLRHGGGEDENRPSSRSSPDEDVGAELLTSRDGIVVVDPEAMTIQFPQTLASSRSVNNNNTNNTVSLEELQEERELARRRTGACVLCAVFVLFLLWIEALTNGDFGQLLLCLVGTSWTARWIRHNREREEELDRRIALYLENAEPGTTELNRSDLRMLSFQAQLALAIMESQRQMMMGGYGHPDGITNDHSGVSNEARQRWERFHYKTIAASSSPVGSSTTKTESSISKNGRKGEYGVVSQQDGKRAATDEDAQCSICLSEYEEGEPLVCLPCRHVYHEECVNSWTSNHTRCPLCNFDLESVADTASVTSRAPHISIV